MFNFVFPLGSLFLKQGVIWRFGVNNIYQMVACGSVLMGSCVVGCCMWSSGVRVSYINKECVLRSCYLPDNYCILLHCVCFFCKKMDFFLKNGVKKWPKMLGYNVFLYLCASLTLITEYYERTY